MSGPLGAREGVSLVSICWSLLLLALHGGQVVAGAGVSAQPDRACRKWHVSGRQRPGHSPGTVLCEVCPGAVQGPGHTRGFAISGQVVRSAKLTLLRGETYDDLDGGLDDLTGYRSVLRGTAAAPRGFDTPQQELAGIVEQLRSWISEGTPLDALATSVLHGLREAGIPRVELTHNGPKGRDCVRIGTMHRFKGLEFQRMIIAGATDGLVPRSGIDRWRATEPTRYRREIQRTRSLLFAAATRARDDLAIL